jgi:hypothetical protein
MAIETFSYKYWPCEFIVNFPLSLHCNSANYLYVVMTMEENGMGIST